MVKPINEVESGFTLVEILTSIVISAILVLGIASMTGIFQDSFRSNKAVNENEQSVYLGMNLLTRELREAVSLDNGTASNLEFTNLAGNTITYELDQARNILTRKEGAGAKAVVANSISFDVEDGQTVSRFEYDAGNIDNVRLITIHLKGIYDGKQLVIENSVAPRNF